MRIKLFDADLIEAVAAQHACGCERCQARQAMLKQAALGRWLALDAVTQAAWLGAHPESGQLGMALRAWLTEASESEDLAGLRADL